MSLEWKSYSLGDVASFKNGKKKVKTEGIYPVYGGNGISDYVSEFNSDGETIVIGRVGAYCGSVYKVTDKCWISDNAIECKIKDHYDFKYLFYLISSLKLNNYRIGSTQPLLTQDILNDISIVLPDLDTQKKISEILNIIDKKIELNISINKNLEQLLHTIFNYWFVSFGKFENSNFTKTFLGDIPEGWNWGVLRDLLTLTKNSIKANETNGLPYLPIDIIPMNSLGISELKSDDEANSSLITFDKNDILIGAMRVYFHRVVISPCSGVTRSTCFVLKPKKEEYLSYLLLLCNLDQTIQYAQNTSKGTTMPYAVWDNGLGDMDIIIPPENVLKEFHELVFPIIEKIRDSYNEINKLQQLRNTLLPKLMSGEIDVSKINCDLE